MNMIPSFFLGKGHKVEAMNTGMCLVENFNQTRLGETKRIHFYLIGLSKTQKEGL